MSIQKVVTHRATTNKHKGSVVGLPQSLAPLAPDTSPVKSLHEFREESHKFFEGLHEYMFINLLTSQFLNKIRKHEKKDRSPLSLTRESPIKVSSRTWNELRGCVKHSFASRKRNSAAQSCSSFTGKASSPHGRILLFYEVHNVCTAKRVKYTCSCSPSPPHCWSCVAAHHKLATSPPHSGLQLLL